MENENEYGGWEDGTADQYRAGLLNEFNDVVIVENGTWGLEFHDYLMLLTNELIRVTKHE